MIKLKADKMGSSKDKRRTRWEYREILKSCAKKTRRQNNRKAIQDYELCEKCTQ